MEWLLPILFAAGPSSEVGLISGLLMTWLLVMGHVAVKDRPPIRLSRRRLLAAPILHCRWCHRAIPRGSMIFFLNSRPCCSLRCAHHVYDQLTEVKG